MYVTLGVAAGQGQELFLRACRQQQPVTIHPAGIPDARTWTGYLALDGDGGPIISLPADSTDSDHLQDGRLISGTFSVAGQQYYFRTALRQRPRACRQPGCAREHLQVYSPSSLAHVVARQRLRARLPDDKLVVGFFEPLHELNEGELKATRFEALLAGVVPGGLVAMTPPGLVLDTGGHYRLAWTCPQSDQRLTLLAKVVHQHPAQSPRARWLGLRCLPGDDFAISRSALLALVETSVQSAPAPASAAQGPDSGTC